MRLVALHVPAGSIASNRCFCTSNDAALENSPAEKLKTRIHHTGEHSSCSCKIVAAVIFTSHSLSLSFTVWTRSWRRLGQPFTSWPEESRHKGSPGCGTAEKSLQITSGPAAKAQGTRITTARREKSADEVEDPGCPREKLEALQPYMLNVDWSLTISTVNHYL